jgi:hypothetical protein
MITKIAIIGGAPRTTFIESLTGEKVEFVQIHEKDAEFLTQKTHSVGCSILNKPTDTILTVYRPAKKKGHKRPYKFHS